MPAQIVHGSFRQPSKTLASLGHSVLDSLTDRIAVLDTAGFIVACNHAWKDFADACGAAAAATCEGANYLSVCDAVIGKDAQDAQHISTLLKEMSVGIREEFTAEYPCHGPEPGQEAWFEIRATAFHHDGAHFITVVHSDRTTRVKAVRERARADRIIERLRRLMGDLHQTQSRLRRAQEAAGIVAFEMDLPAAPMVIPKHLHRLLGMPTHTHAGGVSLIDAAHASDRPGLRAALSCLAAKGGTLRHEFRLQPVGGEARWIQLLGIGESVAGPPYRFVGIAMEVTERRKSDAQRELLGREIDHRARNVLAVVQAVLRLSRPREGGAYAEALEGRIAALARAHVLLSEASWAGASLGDIVEGEIQPFRGADGPVISIEGQRIALAPGAAQPFSLVLHELATNAAKYGALSRATGRLGVCWRIDTHIDHLVLSWQERGGPSIVGPPARRGFGTRVIAATVRHQLGGSLTQNWEPEGLSVEISVPLERVLRAKE